MTCPGRKWGREEAVEKQWQFLSFFLLFSLKGALASCKRFPPSHSHLPSSLKRQVSDAGRMFVDLDVCVSLNS